MSDVTSSPKVARVVVAVFDGLRPDMVRPDLTPNIVRVAAKGEWFRQARSVFPSVTRVATTSIATGAPPSVHGIVGNAFYFPEIIKDRIFDTSKGDDIRAVEAALGGHYITAATFGDQLAKAGKTLAVVHAGSAGSAHSINPRAKANGHWTFSIHGETATQTPEAVREAMEKFGPLPAKELPKLKDQDYAARVMTDLVLPRRPDVALVWFSEPDTSFHYLEIGSEGSLAALKNADRAFGTILDAIEAMPDSDEVAVIVASDHGQISTERALPLFDQARESGITIGVGYDLQGKALVATTGSSGEVRIESGDDNDLERMAGWLMDHPDISHVLTRDKNGVEGIIDGTLSLNVVGQTHARSADLMYILRSDVSLDRYGLPGLGLLMPGDVAPGGGYHGGINPHELNTVLIAAHEASFAAGESNNRPAGIIDIGPTILDLLGIPKASTMVGTSLRKPAKSEAKNVTFETIKGNFSQQIMGVEDEGRRLILHGGHL
jgi:phosphonoacetate hydrolase